MLVRAESESKARPTVRLVPQTPRAHPARHHLHKNPELSVQDGKQACAGNEDWRTPADHNLSAAWGGDGDGEAVVVVRVGASAKRGGGGHLWQPPRSRGPSWIPRGVRRARARRGMRIIRWEAKFAGWFGLWLWLWGVVDL